MCEERCWTGESRRQQRKIPRGTGNGTCMYKVTGTEGLLAGYLGPLGGSVGIELGDVVDPRR